MPYDLPDDITAEVSLIGTGGGYGESCVIHLGNKCWAVVDSCIDPYSKESLPLKYLKDIGVDLATQVKFILCTHWHDDHILGLSNLLKECKGAMFSISRANDKQKFLQLMSMDYKKITAKGISNSSTKEFNECLEVLISRNSGYKDAAADKTLYSTLVNSAIRSELISLSPSEFTTQQFDKEISSLITDYGSPSTRIIPQDPNSKSVVLFVKIGDHRAILGADLEVTNDNRQGWLNILDSNQVIDKKSSLFKIPHHGSENGYTDRIWLELLEKNPISKLTPWNKNGKLPKEEMLKLYCTKSDTIYMTAAIKSNKPKQRERRIEKILDKWMKNKLREVKYSKGVIRCRIKMDDSNAKWTVDLFENAIHINPLV